MPPKRARTTKDESVGRASKKLKTEQKTTKVKSPQKKAAKAGKAVKTKEPATKQAPKKVTGAATDAWLIDLINDPDWKSKLDTCLQDDIFKNMQTWLHGEYETTQVFPPKELIFNAFNLTPFNDIKVVILGQDPYHDDGQAHGLSFSVPYGVDIPPSLKNIYKELESDIPGFKAPTHGNLQDWSNQGVLMLNAALTVQAHKPNSHARCGWWKFTDAVIKLISDQAQPCVFLLWGGFAQKKASLIDSKKHRIIKTAHPSPLSVTKFRNCKCFSMVNDNLKELGKGTIDWTIQPKSAK